MRLFLRLFYAYFTPILRLFYAYFTPSLHRTWRAQDEGVELPELRRRRHPHLNQV
jgi:hypothetical protein